MPTHAQMNSTAAPNNTNITTHANKKAAANTTSVGSSDQSAARAFATHDSDDSSDDDDMEQQLQYKICILGDGAVGKTSITSRFTSNAFSSSYKQTIGVDFFIKRVTLPNNVQVALQIWDIGGQTIGSSMLAKYMYGSQCVIVVCDITNTQSFSDVDDWCELLKKQQKQQQQQQLQLAQRNSNIFAAEANSNNISHSRSSSSIIPSPPTAPQPSAPLPYIALCANKCDLQHLRAVKQEKLNSYITEFNDTINKETIAASNNNSSSSNSAKATQTMHSFNVSAKSGDGVNAMFYKIAADLAGVVLTKSQLEAAGSSVQRAEIVNYAQNDASQPKLVMKETKTKDCCIM